MLDRFEREVRTANSLHKASTTLRKAVNQLLAEHHHTTDGHSTYLDRDCCNFRAAISPCMGTHDGEPGSPAPEIARLTSLSEHGFEVILPTNIDAQKVVLMVEVHPRKLVAFLGEVLWCRPRGTNTLFSAGGRLLEVLPAAWCGQTAGEYAATC